jgi:hypothetical protein
MGIIYLDNVLIFLHNGTRKISHHSLNIAEEVPNPAYKYTTCILHQYGTSDKHKSENSL